MTFTSLSPGDYGQFMGGLEDSITRNLTSPQDCAVQNRVVDLMVKYSENIMIMMMMYSDQSYPFCCTRLPPDSLAAMISAKSVASGLCC